MAVTQETLSRTKEVRHSYILAAALFFQAYSFGLYIVTENTQETLITLFLGAFLFGVGFGYKYTVGGVYAGIVGIFLFMVGMIVFLLVSYGVVRALDFIALKEPYERFFKNFFWAGFYSEEEKQYSHMEGCRRYNLANVREDPDVLRLRKLARYSAIKKGKMAQERRKLFRKLALKYHPDRCVREGCTEECEVAMNYITSIIDP